MKRKTMLVVTAALSALAFAALPSIALASESPTLTVESTTHFTSVSGHGVLHTANGRTYTCESDTNTGHYTNGHVGWRTDTFHGCRETVLNSKCTTPGEESGTVMSAEELPFETVYLSDGEPGILTKPNAESGVFMQFSCLAGLVNVVIKGNGVLGRVTSPGFEEPSNTSVLDVSATGEGQEYTETEASETYGLEASLNGGEFEPLYTDAGEDEITFAEEMEPETLE